MRYTIVTFQAERSSETISEACEAIITKDNMDGVESEVIIIFIEHLLPRGMLETKIFDIYARFQEYVELYKECISSN